MPWYVELQGLTDVASFARYLNNHDRDLGRVMAQALRIRQLQLKDDSIPGTWQAKTPDARVAELVCSYGHGQKKSITRAPDGSQVETPVDFTPFEKTVRRCLGHWLRLCEDVVKATEADPATPSSPRDPEYYAIAARKLAAQRAVAPLGPFPRNGSIGLILRSFATAADEWEPALESAYADFRRYAVEQAARDYAEQMARQDEARLDVVARKAIDKIRKHQKMKIDGGALGKGGHEDGNFWLLERAIDGRPILLVSSKTSKDVKDPYIGEATSYASAMGTTICKGYYSQDKKGGEIRFHVEAGQAQTPTFVAALDAIGAKKRTVLCAPAANAWAAATRGAGR